MGSFLNAHMNEIELIQETLHMVCQARLSPLLLYNMSIHSSQFSSVQFSSMFLMNAVTQSPRLALKEEVRQLTLLFESICVVSSVNYSGIDPFGK